MADTFAGQRVIAKELWRPAVSAGGRLEHVEQVQHSLRVVSRRDHVLQSACVRLILLAARVAQRQQCVPDARDLLPAASGVRQAQEYSDSQFSLLLGSN